VGVHFGDGEDALVGRTSAYMRVDVGLGRGATSFADLVRRRLLLATIARYRGKEVLGAVRCESAKLGQ
jgi:hypothetical protein